MSTYAVDIDLDNPNTSHFQVLELIGDARRILDVGCWTGDLGNALLDRGCRVSGVEIDEEAAATAAESFERVVVADLDTSLLSSHFEAGSFDVIVFADVLEHLLHPREVLADAVSLLASDGRIVISIPNVAHGSLRLAHLQGRWDLSDTGLLDRTHIRFFNRQGLMDLLDEAGLVVEELRGTTADPLAVEVDADGVDLPESVVEWVRDQPDALVYQFQVRARARRGSEPVGRHVPLREGLPAEQVRRRDHHTAARERAIRDSFAVKDHILGLQAELTNAELNIEERVRASFEPLQRRFEERRALIRDLRQQLRDLRLQLRETREQLRDERLRVEALSRDLERRGETALPQRLRRKMKAAARRLGE